MLICPARTDLISLPLNSRPASKRSSRKYSKPALRLVATTFTPSVIRFILTQGIRRPFEARRPRRRATAAKRPDPNKNTIRPKKPVCLGLRKHQSACFRQIGGNTRKKIREDGQGVVNHHALSIFSVIPNQLVAKTRFAVCRVRGLQRWQQILVGAESRLGPFAYRDQHLLCILRC